MPYTRKNLELCEWKSLYYIIYTTIDSKKCCALNVSNSITNARLEMQYERRKPDSLFC